MLIFIYKMGSSIFEGYSTVQRSDTNEILILDYKIKQNGKKPICLYCHSHSLNYFKTWLLVFMAKVNQGIGL